MRVRILQVLLLMYITFLSEAQQQTKAPISDRDILSVLGKQPQPNLASVPVPLPEQASAKQTAKSPPSLTVEPLRPQQVSGVDVISSLQSACQALAMFISRSQQMQRYLSLMPPGLMPWLYAMKLGFPTECGFSSYSNALNVFSTACSVFETCPLPSPLMDVAVMFPNVSAGLQMTPEFRGGLGLPGVQMSAFIPQFPQQSFPVQRMPLPPIPDQFVPFQPLEARPGPTIALPDQQVPVPVDSLRVQPPVPIQPVPSQPIQMTPRALTMPVPSQPISVKPRALTMPERSLPEIRTRGRKVQVQAQQIRIPNRPMMPGWQQNQPRVQVITKLVPRPPENAPQSVPKPVVIPQPQTLAPQQTFQRMPVPSMGSFYPLWFYGFQQGPTAVNVGRSVRPTTSPRPRRPEHDHSD